MNNCKNCKYYGEYNDGKFTLPICKLYNNLKDTVDAINNCENCKDFKNKFDLTEAIKTFKNTTETFKKFGDAVQSLEEKALHKLNKEKKLNKFNYYYEFCERQKQRRMYEEEIDKVEQLEKENKKLKNGYLILRDIAKKYDDKETPEEPIKSGTIYNDFEPITKYSCKCGRELSFSYNYCPKCGQKIDWKTAN